MKRFARTAVLIIALLAISLPLVGTASCDDFLDNWKPLSPDEQLKENERKRIEDGENKMRQLAETGQLRSEAQEVELFNNANPYAIIGGSNNPASFTLDKPTTIGFIQTYHWDSGKPPGEISLKAEDGTVYGPWKAKGVEGQGGMPNAYWEVEPNEALEPGTYTVIDSDPATWSTNEEMSMVGQTIVRGYPEE